MNRLSTILLLTLGSAQLLDATTTSPAAAAKQIDDLLGKDWAKNKLKPNPPASDEVFVRRIYLDVAGRIPTFRETEEFLKTQGGNKRAELIDKLLASEGYVQHFYNFWADILRAQTQPQNSGGSVSGTAYSNFIKESLRTNKPYDQFVRELVSAQGNIWDNGAIGYYMRDRAMPLDNMAATVRVFLGTRIECAQCHNHPFDKWSQMQFYQMAAFTYGVDSNDYNGGSLKGVRKLIKEHEETMRLNVKASGGKPDPAMIAEQEKLRVQAKHVSEALNQVRNPLRYTSLEFRVKSLQLPQDYKYPDAKPKATVQPAVIMGGKIDDGQNQLDAYAKWIASPENPRFTNVIVNRLWKKLFGQGLIEPVDELMDNTVASNPELMAWLEKYMVSVNYDMKACLRAMLNTQTYQNSVSREEVPPGVVFHFTGPLLRRMTAEQIWDSFVALINPTPDMPNLPVREATEKRILGSKKLSDALESLTPEELLTAAEVAGEKYAEQSRRLKELQHNINVAREEGDKEKVRQLTKESGILQNAGQKAVNDHIFAPALKKLARNVSGKTEGLADDIAGEMAPLGENTMMMKGDKKMDAAMSQIEIPGYDLPKKTKEQIAAAEDEQKKVILDEAAYFGLAEKEQKAYLQYRQQQMRTWLRSAEIESPAPRGHYLREFGQSDRETIENANNQASVPQALAMMNSQLLPQIMERYSQLMLTINKTGNPDDQIHAAYLTLLSRKPTTKEKSVWTEAHSKGLSTIDDLIYALINTQQFIFIQ